MLVFSEVILCLSLKKSYILIQKYNFILLFGFMEIFFGQLLLIKISKSSLIKIMN